MGLADAGRIERHAMPLGLIADGFVLSSGRAVRLVGVVRALPRAELRPVLGRGRLRLS